MAPVGPASGRFTAGGGTFLSVVPPVESYSPAGEKLVREIRSVSLCATFGAMVWVFQQGH